MLFYFDVRDHGQHFSDEEGQDLPDTRAAEGEAAEAAVAIAADVLPQRRSGAVIVEVRDQRRELLLTVSVELRIAHSVIPKR